MSQALLAHAPQEASRAPRLEVVPPHVLQWLARQGVNEDAVELALASDLDLEGRPGRTWVVCTRQALWVVPERPPTEQPSSGGPARRRQEARREGGAVSSGPAPGELAVAEEQVQRFASAEVMGFRVENLVGNGLLVAQVAGADVVLCRFSQAVARQFGLFVRLAEKVRKGEAIEAGDVDDDQLPAFCPKCGLRYPEPNRPLCPKCLDRRSIFRRVLSFVPQYKLQITLIIACMLASSGLRVLNPYLGGRILYDEVLTPGGRWAGQVGPAVLAMMASQLLALLISIAYGRINAAMTAQVVFDLKTRVFAAMQQLSMRFFSSKQTGGLMTRVNQDAMHLQYFFHDGIPYFIVNCLMILGVLGSMLALNWRLTLLVLLPVPLMAWAMRVFLPYFWDIYDRRYRQTRSLLAVINDALTGVRVVKAFGREEAEVGRFKARNLGLYEVTLQSGNLGSTLFPALSFLMSLGSLLVWGLGGWEVMTGQITFGTLITFTGYLGMLYGPLEFMTHVVDWWSSCMNSAQRIFEILDATPDVAEHPQAVRLPAMRGEVELSRVTFGYEPHKPVLRDIHLKVAAGEMIGLVGHSGAGKSTLTNLITRLYDVDEGVIRIDGVDVRRVATADLRRQIGMVLQETYLFAGSIAENIAYARPDASPEAILAAARAANAHDFIVALPDGYDTDLGRRGRDLSGGEKQRIAIARAILHDPRILILDEATSSLDTETERKIQEALARLVQGRTTFAIAHRLSTLRDADRLVVLEQGKQVEMGTHEELVAKQGVYYKLLQIQREALRIRGVDEEMLAQVEEQAQSAAGRNGAGPAAAQDDLRYLEPTQLRFSRTPGGFLALTIGEREHHPRVTLYRCFPLSRLDQYISVRDGEGKEIGLIVDLNRLPAEMRQLVVEELDRRYFAPRVERAVSVKEEFGYLYWEVETDRGPRRFTVRNTPESLLVLGPTHVLLIDVDGNRFEVPDYRQLGPRAARYIEVML